MTQGRQSAAALSVRQNEAAKPEPPGDMPVDQAVIWRRVAAGLPADWFGVETYGMLVQYCRHEDRANTLAKAINRVEAQGEPTGKDKGRYMNLLHEELAQTKAMIELATKMRITQQATYDKSKRKPKDKSTLWSAAA